DYTDDPFEELELQEALQGRYTGGTVVHLYMGERISSAEACKRLVRRALEGFRVPYLTITPTFSICPTHGYLSGEHTFCPHCDDQLRAAGHSEPLPEEKRTRCEVWTRVMGYHRPVQSWNAGKQAEHRERAFFEERRATKVEAAA
ncbi:anaerobic ribonucleoside-triphosphate reductase, partial [Halorhodospira abdelmalekii]|uniref:anaerobic ribonucleoside-triphosphate reductase n=1 Tax=Halorhodospira abdelmalekii TaxID=421629 RepID=UPI00237BF6B1